VWERGFHRLPWRGQDQRLEVTEVHAKPRKGAKASPCSLVGSEEGQGRAVLGLWMFSPLRVKK
jgi:hypothetical protein